ncbi:orf73 [Lactobacillus phage LP65]|uniref:Orf73 n=1 Tax=Lactobacillus phage LP65 TaxID=2892344 RepID=Q5ULP1_9CAUD|nr:hypothetical protein LP65_gp073 [Lactobacillus phage LP65]AAV35893.1 orf73 [Lactobacillus phage LP65]
MDKRSKYLLVNLIEFLVQIIALIANLIFVKNDFISGIVLTLIFVVPEIVAGVVRNGVVSKKKFRASFYNMLEFTLYVFSIAALFIPVGYLNSILPVSGEVATSSVEVSLVLVMISIVIMLTNIISNLCSSIDKMYK